MSIIEIKVPTLPESVTDGSIATWYKKPGEFIKRDEHLLDIETDKVVIEVVAPEDGVLESIKKNPGDTVKAEEVVALFKTGAAENINKDASSSEQGNKPEQKNKTEKKTEKSASTDRQEAKPERVSAGQDKAQPALKTDNRDREDSEDFLSPAVRRLMSQKGLTASQIQGSGRGGRITTEDVENTAAKTKKVTASAGSDARSNKETMETLNFPPEQRIEKRVPMTRLRAKIAERLIQAQQNAAILTTFNEINMQPVMTLRSKYKDNFEKAYGVRLGFMSFFTMAVVEALKHFPIINASTDGNDIIYHAYYDIGIAVSSPRGLVVPVLRNAETLSMAEIEKQIAEYSNKAQAGQLSIEDITGGTFTLSNGGVFGSLMSTPILNPPQSAILGMHKIQERPVVENGQIVIRPMMYVALSYDHRIIDGVDSVRFLVSVKELLEDPARLALGI